MTSWYEKRNDISTGYMVCKQSFCRVLFARKRSVKSVLTTKNETQL